MPDQRESVPEDERWITSCLTCVNLICSVDLRQSDFHKLGNVQGEGENGDWNYVDEQSFGVCHRLREEVDRDYLKRIFTVTIVLYWWGLHTAMYLKIVVDE